jgi:hypothetical protein
MTNAPVAPNSATVSGATAYHDGGRMDLLRGARSTVTPSRSWVAGPSSVPLVGSPPASARSPNVQFVPFGTPTAYISSPSGAVTVATDTTTASPSAAASAAAVDS